ncbi:MAG TPA: hypothetical protein PKL73_20975 [Polyangiaceae bacterium]|nr:MAG: hypothetical protein BWY17_00971 [Deltaproteobacteria bacterium ADurb.Bin207]HNS99445.1 hypothetical protein [Polyangiaceae bacterium]HNZ21373.1 hypothetical protein [Polyangiaceae bacterium]HOD23989.1 hypothetical protein [Polyangiaceae bacterium]HOE47452.1 hypothetical protein [Polyangiaceae bacterium]
MLNPRSLSIPLVALSLASAHPAHAQQPQPYYYTEYSEQWYGWQNLAVDVPLLTTFVIAQTHGQDTFALGTMGAFVVGSPIVHLAHHRVPPAVLSGFSHLLLPLGGYALLRPVVGEIAPSSSKDTQIAAAVSITSLAALSLDVLWLAYDQTESEVRFESRARWIPHIALTTHSASLGWQF